ncbi:MAG: hypothetical protein EXR59_03895 [Dehalococcoidia bacterium]|nr:hypothetical protein [Dehalococcoidia bacterium]
MPSSITGFFILGQGFVFLLLALAFGSYYIGDRRKKQEIIAASLFSLSIVSLLSPLYLHRSSSPVNKVVESYKYNIPEWEISHASRQLLQRMTHPFSRPDPTSADSIAKLKAFFDLNRQISSTKAQLATAEARGQATDISTSQDSLRVLSSKQDMQKFEAELILERLVAQEALKEGMTRGFLGMRFMWPPVGLSIENRPTILAVSPRDHIQLDMSALLKSGVSRDTRESIEGGIASLDLSGLVIGIGGVATYPAILPDDGDLESALEISAHEWLHHYLFFHQLGRNYYASGQMTSINETVANMWGKEIGTRLYCQYFTKCAPEVAPPPIIVPPPPATSPSNVFDFNREMRSIRLKVDEMLKQGKIEQAEAYMEDRRKFLVENNYIIRKLNQAYFAFYGSYGDEPSVVSPIGDQLRIIRLENGTVGDFIRQVQVIGNVEEFDAAFAEVSNGG